ncbi:hypothetical protein [Desulfofalx alkaliphila]|uniref:hypothetical protein n=1 Tax=Desulfofalx alkaliphila TaxID=105483 RepID=UPI0004E25F7B|nr:hypothetical protein [Desulfofalx alkaliphila]
MEWIATFIISWVIFFIFIDKERLKHTALGGLAAIILQLVVDTGASAMGLYQVDSMFQLGGASALFTFGVVFTMGTLFVQFMPAHRWLKVAHIVALSTLFLGLEYLLVQRNLITYPYWSMWASYFTNLMVFIAITWLAGLLRLTATPDRY